MGGTQLTDGFVFLRLLGKCQEIFGESSSSETGSKLLHLYINEGPPHTQFYVAISQEK